MHSDVLERWRVTYGNNEAPPFPLAAIRSATTSAPQAQRRRSPPAALLVASFSIIAFAAAAELREQTRVHFTPSGGMVISSHAKMGSRPIHSDAEIAEAAQHLNFMPILPVGLPSGTKPIRLFTAGTDMLAITYDLPGAQRQSHHLLWIFVANRATMPGPASQIERRNNLHSGKRMSIRVWDVGKEAVTAVSNGLTAQEFSAIKRAMDHEATR